MIEVARRSPVPIATGESLSTKQQFAELLKFEVVNIIQVEPLNVGGLFAAVLMAVLHWPTENRMRDYAERQRDLAANEGNN